MQKKINRYFSIRRLQMMFYYVYYDGIDFYGSACMPTITTTTNSKRPLNIINQCQNINITINIINTQDSYLSQYP